MRSQGAEGDKTKHTEPKGEEADMKNTEPRCAERDQRTMNQRAREELRTLNCKGSKGDEPKSIEPTEE